MVWSPYKRERVRLESKMKKKRESWIDVISLKGNVFRRILLVVILIDVVTNNRGMEP